MAKLFVIAGHGAGDPGAVGFGFTEAERVRALAGRIKHFGGSSVSVGDMSRNWYQDNGIATLNISEDYCIIELHMDASDGSARGGHVIINAGLNPDQYDNALAEFIGRILPGRSNLITGRSDLANPNLAATRGLNYRLVECGFITNSVDVSIFNNKMDKIAKGILSSFGIESVGCGESEQGTSQAIINATVRENSGADFMRLAFETVDAGNKIFRIRDKANGYLLTAAANKADANVDFRGFGCGDYQEWKVLDKRYKNADYKMFECVAAPGLYLSVENNGNGGKNNLKLYNDLHNMKQKFYIREESDGRTLVIHAFSGKCVSAK